jgi:alpha-tubulin suppressor-like RCC1 family protein
LLLAVACTGCTFTTREAPSDATAGDVSIDTAHDAAACSVAAVVAGGDHTCALTSDGAVYCWGLGQSGELGIGSVATTCSYVGGNYQCSATPQHVALSGAVSLALGSYHSCAATATGTYCWGSNRYGGFGDGSTAGSPTPLAIAARAGATAVDAGRYHTCSLASGSVACSGPNFSGEVGNNSTVQQATATAVLANAKSLALGDYLSCATDAQDQLWCWGRNAYREIDSSGQNRLTPTMVSGLLNVAQVAPGVDHICAALQDHTAACWGSNAYGQLGTGATSTQPQAPTQVPVVDVVQVAADRNHTCVRDGAGAVWCFGDTYPATPMQIALPRPAIMVTAGSNHDCALTDDHEVWCWGNQDFGQLGNGVSSSARVLEPQHAPVCP